jgi:hypothetical protein
MVFVIEMWYRATWSFLWACWLNFVLCKWQEISWWVELLSAFSWVVHGCNSFSFYCWLFMYIVCICRIQYCQCNPHFNVTWYNHSHVSLPLNWSQPVTLVLNYRDWTFWDPQFPKVLADICWDSSWGFEIHWEVRSCHPNWKLYCPNSVLMWELCAEQCIANLFRCIVTLIVASEYFRSQFEVFCHAGVENSPSSSTVCVWCL